jgi:hypothetical protein
LTNFVQISLKTGEGLYLDLKSQIKSKGVKQRTHEVQVRDDGVYVRVVADGTAVESDRYANLDNLNTSGSNVRERVDLRAVQKQRAESHK